MMQSKLLHSHNLTLSLTLSLNLNSQSIIQSEKIGNKKY
jgi:hypothetical protein